MQTDVRKRERRENLVATAIKTYSRLHCAFNDAIFFPRRFPRRR